MVKLRDARYCNIKLLLIFLVIYGHLIEPGIWQSKVLMTQYKWIYLFHMPLFCFLSGLFLNDSKACARQLIKMLSVYIVLQVLAVCFGKDKVKPATPYWHLWYLLSYCAWAGFGWLWFRFFGRKGTVSFVYEYYDAFHSHNGGGQTLYDIHYEYYVDDQVYTGVIEQQHAPKKEGDSFKVKYNPQNPEENTRKLEPSKSYLVSGSVFATVGLLMVISTVVLIKKGKSLTK